MLQSQKEEFLRESKHGEEEQRDGMGHHDVEGKL